MGVGFVLLTLGASFDVFLYILDPLRPPVVLGHQLFCSIDTWVSVSWYVVVGLDDFALVLSGSCDYLACVLRSIKRSNAGILSPCIRLEL